MNNNRDINFQSTERQKRILPEDSFGDWKWREALAESMIPLIGALYRDGVNILCLLYTSPSPRDRQKSRMPSSA